ncbi:hypothetical protein HETIRDRAFT_456024 [Heterobasidion irregulare TC 32-1]|uniref:DUF6534 domain-containing protein n=1 Tax=Heterobasidion irregulare (strain TC 32-1) TaxID=747525 RepID=W4JPL8_HETIT|nr:uncharacterized protein HETIRDRAFT_456024 [Heterobasidion irregulare TC 32-1]ETW75414.1 hypothetical protein HETIRDRAFT_456024 [Heterobasidion irregulare TC 32-1]
MATLARGTGRAHDAGKSSIPMRCRAAWVGPRRRSTREQDKNKGRNWNNQQNWKRTVSRVRRRPPIRNWGASVNSASLSGDSTSERPRAPWDCPGMIVIASKQQLAASMRVGAPRASSCIAPLRCAYVASPAAPGPGRAQAADPQASSSTSSLPAGTTRDQPVKDRKDARPQAKQTVRTQGGVLRRSPAILPRARRLEKSAGLVPRAASMRVGLPVPSPQSTGRQATQSHRIASHRIAARRQRAATYRILPYSILYISTVEWTLERSVDRSSRRVRSRSQSQALPPSLLPPASVGEMLHRAHVHALRARQAEAGRSRRARVRACASLDPAEKSQEVAGCTPLARGGATPGAQASREAPAARILRALSSLHTGASSSGVLRKAPSGARAPPGTHARARTRTHARTHAREHEEPPRARARRIAVLVLWACARVSGGDSGLGARGSGRGARGAGLSGARHRATRRPTRAQRADELEAGSWQREVGVPLLKGKRAAARTMHARTHARTPDDDMAPSPAPVAAMPAMPDPSLCCPAVPSPTSPAISAPPRPAPSYPASASAAAEKYGARGARGGEANAVASRAISSSFHVMAAGQLPTRCAPPFVRRLRRGPPLGSVHWRMFPPLMANDHTVERSAYPPQQIRRALVHGAVAVLPIATDHDASCAKLRHDCEEKTNMAPLPGVPPDIALIQGPLVRRSCRLEIPLTPTAGHPILSGIQLLGYLFGYGLFGVLVVQMYFYHLNFPKDDRWIKIFVWVVFSAEILSSVFSTIAAWQGLAAGWGDLDSLAAPTWSFTALPPICGFISSCVQLFFCWRISVLGNGRVLPVFIAVISILSWAMAFYCGIKASSPVAKINEFDPEVTASCRSDLSVPSLIGVQVGLTGSAVCDVMIAVVMVRFLIRASSSAHWTETKDMLHKMTKLTVQTGTATALGATVELVFFWAFHHNNVHFVLPPSGRIADRARVRVRAALGPRRAVFDRFLVLAKLYSNTILATLNARAAFKSDSWVSSSSASAPSDALWADSRASLAFAPGWSATATATATATTTTPTHGTTHESGSAMQMVALPRPLETAPIEGGEIRGSRERERGDGVE